MNWLRNWFGKRTPPKFKKLNRPSSFRPGVEALETREVLAVVGLGTPVLLAPSGNTTSAEPVFSWNAVASADHYEIVVNDQTSGVSQLEGNSDVQGTSWASTAALNQGDTYTWNVQAFDSTGTIVSNWSATASFTVVALGAPTLLGPSGSLTIAEPTFTWNAVSGADHYDIWVNDQTTGAAQVIRNEDVTGTSWTATQPLLGGHNYQWWVRAVDNSDTNPGAWSNALQFSVASLAQPTLIGPVGMASSDTPMFTWNAVTGADHYDIWVNDLTTGQSALARDQDVLGTSWTPTTALTPNHQYQWWVRAVDSTNTNLGPWSASLSFSVAGLGQAVLVGPTGATTSDTPQFSWNAVTGADHYEVWVNDQTTGQSEVLLGSDVGGTTWTASAALAPGHTYQWWAQAQDSTGTSNGSWSVPQEFTVTGLATPTLVGPVGAVGSVVGNEPTFTWNAVPAADHYQIQVSDLTSGQTAAILNDYVVGTSWTATTALNPMDTFRWWIRAADSTSTYFSAWSNPLNFELTALASPPKIGPGGAVANSEPTFSWVAVPGANHYDVYIQNLTSSQAAVVRNTNVAGTTWVPTAPLTVGDTYSWWARAVDSSGNPSAWSPLLDFVVTALPAPNPIGPQGGTLNAAKPTFTWAPVTGADHYDVWVTDVTTDTAMAFRDQDIATNTWTPPTALTSGNTYTWWVRAADKSGGDDSNWSPGITFTVSA